ncbi:MAG: hypothetical protein R3246_14215 [Acidimicrobiia bacterium]|nr:hypothetical protein [Acidimicrobiia bacterium]
MKIEGIGKAWLDDLSNIETNPDFPQVGPSIMQAFFRDVGVRSLGVLSTGAVTGTGAAIKVGSPDSDTPDVEDATMICDPSVVIVHNAANDNTFIHVAGMAAASMWRLADGVAPALVAADGITLGSSQFTIGADANLNGVGNALTYTVLGR